MSKISENGLFGQKKAPAGWFHSKTKVVNIFRNIPDPTQTQLYLKPAVFILNLVKIKDLQLKSLKTHEIVPKAKLRTLSARRDDTLQ